MPYMNEIVLAAAFFVVLIGIAGCVLPVIPGPPIALAALFMVHFTDYADFQIKTLVIYSCLIIAVTVLDYILPAIGTRKFGGTKRGMWGAALGLFAGLILFPPLGFVIGAFAGAFAAELTGGMHPGPAVKAAAGSLMGLLAGTAAKVVICLVMALHILIHVIV